MTPLEAARKIKERGCGETSDRWMGTSCYFCDAVLHSGGDIWPATGHAADCPWLTMPKIIAALEAAEKVASVWQRDIDRRGDEAVPSHIRLAHVAPLIRAAGALLKVMKG